jgi:phenylalanyl-tRNA synthetase beta chain
MKISLSWLKDYVAVNIPPEKLAHKLTMAGFEVEHIEKVAGDSVFELEITPNRPDCLSMLGIARELSAIFNKPLKSPFKKFPAPKASRAAVTIEDKKDCSRYIGTVIAGVKVNASPDWIRKRIAAVGLRPINSMVDVTNFGLIESGQPLHAFDFDKLEGGKIVVRRARKGEKIVTLDGVERALDPSILVIADARRPVAIAGIMGGKDTEVTDKTKNVLLESAHFDPVLVRRASRSLGLASDSSYRFERGVDIGGVSRGSARALVLIRQLAGGRVQAHGDYYPGKRKETRSTVSVHQAEIEALLGTAVSVARCRSILKHLGFSVTQGKKGVLKVGVTGFRGDIKHPVDVIEEIARIIGYDSLPTSLPHISLGTIKENERKGLREKIRQQLLAQGLNEAITYAMTNRRDLERCRGAACPPRPEPSARPGCAPTDEILKVKNPLNQDQELMRPTLVPGLLAVLLSNTNRGQKDVRLFELGKIYLRSGEKETLGIAVTGRRCDDWRQSKAETVDFYDLKGFLESVLELNAQDGYRFEPADHPLFESGRGAYVLCAGRNVGIAGKVSRKVLEGWGIKRDDVFLAEMDLEHLYAGERPARKYVPVPEFPAVVLDVSMAIKENVSFERVREIIDELKPDFLTEVRFVEQYLGEKIPQGYRGIVFSLTYQSARRTLREDEALQAHKKICQALTERLGAVRR